MSYDLDKEKQDYTQAFYEMLLSIMTSSGGNLDMSAPRITLIGSVKLKIDELQPQQEGVQFIDAGKVSNVLDMYINGLLDECANQVLQTAPLHVIVPEEGADGAEVLQTGTSKTGVVFLPDNYIRWVSMKMNSWVQEVTEPITTRDEKYKLQKYSATMGKTAKPVAVLNTVRKDNGSAVAQIDTLTLSGASGTANIACAGLAMTATYDTSLAITADNFVTSYAALLLAEGVTLTANSGVLTFTAAVAGTAFTSPWIANSEGDLAGAVVNTTPNVPRYEAKRVAEYYSIGDGGTHTLEKLLYVGSVGAGFIQENLVVPLTWLCASKVLQIMGNVTNQGGGAEKALEQVKLSYENLL